VKKQYRRLALQYHPDRNAGKEEEYIPKFQAIQAAHEILGEPAEKARYDGDRRKAGLYPTSNAGGGASSGGARGNPYQATSAYPPPPRRTQPGTYQRPQASGADRFTNFPRPAPTAKRADPAAERQNAFKAWQNMNNAQDRDKAQQQQQQQSRYAQANAQPQAQAKTASPRRPAPPSRTETKFPTDEKIRAGFAYREAPQASSSADNAEERQSAWAAFQQAHKANSPGVGRSNTNKTPRKQGFDPNMPGSDEGMAPDSQYVHRHKSADFGRAKAAPPPPPRPSRPSSPLATPQRPHAEPLRPFKSRQVDEDAPYSEGNRIRTPYSSFSGERTDFGSDMRRSNSTRDTFNMNTNSEHSRARSTSPSGRTTQGTSAESQHQRRPSHNKPSFSVGGSSSDSSSSSDAERTGSTAQNGKTAKMPQDRPKIVPSPPSRRFNGSNYPASPGGGLADGEMKQKTNSNMYVHINPSPLDTQPQPSFDQNEWVSRMFGSGPASGGSRNEPIPNWAFPASVLPQRMSAKHQRVEQLNPYPSKLKTVDAKTSLEVTTLEERDAFACMSRFLGLVYGSVPSSFDMNVFLELASTARSGEPTGVKLVDQAMNEALALYPSIGYRVSKEQSADNDLNPNRFNFPTSPDMFARNANAKSRSEESINTKFSADGWSGTFSGSTEYFAPPQTSSRRGSPSLRGGQRPGVRTATSGFGQPGSAAQSPTTGAMPPPPRPQDGSFSDLPSAGSETKFSKDQWEQTFKDGSWTWPPPPSIPPPSPAKSGAKGKQPSRKNSRAQSKPTFSGNGTATNPHVVNEDSEETVHPGSNNNHATMNANAAYHEPDVMDIDNTPPATEHPAQQATQTGPLKEPRLVSVPPSAWRQSQQPHSSNGHNRTLSGGSDSVPLTANLNDLANVAPFNQTTDGSGLNDLNPMSTTLPFNSQASNTFPGTPNKPQTLAIPVIPIPPKGPTRLSKQSWHQYAQNFAVYLHAFNKFNGEMLQHFQTRHQQAAAREQRGMGWLEAAGDSSAGGGFGSYAREVMEDVRVREAWNMGCERQVEAVKEFDEVKEKVRRLAVAGSLVDQ
jgi:curved DNA-binding protein CbpA